MEIQTFLDNVKHRQRCSATIYPNGGCKVFAEGYAPMSLSEFERIFDTSADITKPNDKGRNIDTTKDWKH